MIEFEIRHFEAVLSENFTLTQGFEDLARYKVPLDLAFVPPLERRRLSRAAACGFFLYEKFAFKAPPLLVFSSFAGEVNNCYDMLLQLNARQPLSPNAFSLSVLNAPPALMAIRAKNHGEITAMSANPAFEYALINAYAKLAENAEKTGFGESREAFVMSYYESLAENKSDIEFSMLACAVSLKSPNFSLSWQALKGEQNGENLAKLRVSELDFLANSLKNSQHFSVEAGGLKFEWRKL